MINSRKMASHSAIISFALNLEANLASVKNIYYYSSMMNLRLPAILDFINNTIKYLYWYDMLKK